MHVQRMLKMSKGLHTGCNFKQRTFLTVIKRKTVAVQISKYEYQNGISIFKIML